MLKWDNVGDFWFISCDLAVSISLASSSRLLFLYVSEKSEDICCYVEQFGVGAVVP